jgi:hypothetical protein
MHRLAKSELRIRLSLAFMRVPGSRRCKNGPLTALFFARSTPVFMRVGCEDRQRTEWPREESNLRTQVRSLPLYPLSYGA